MAEYKLCSIASWNGNRMRTEAYQFTVESLDDPLLVALKKEIARNNKAMRALARQTGREYYAHNLKRVRVMPRGPRVEAAWGDYKSRRAYDSYLPIRHATHFDVYVQKDDKVYKLIRELQTGLTPGMQDKIERLQAEIWCIAEEGRRNLDG